MLYIISDIKRYFIAIKGLLRCVGNEGDLEKKNRSSGIITIIQM